MKNIKVVLVALAMVCTFSGYAQEEFFGNKPGLSASYSQNFSFDRALNSDEIERADQLSLYLPNGLILAGDYSTIQFKEFYGASIGYVLNHDDKYRVKCLIALSYGELVNYFKTPSLGIALAKVFFTDSKFPFSIGASTSMNFIYFNKEYFYMQRVASIGYTQSFFANFQLYPVIGISKSFSFIDDLNNGLSNNRNNTNEGLFFHIGLNLKLSQSDTKK